MINDCRIRFMDVGWPLLACGSFSLPLAAFACLWLPLHAFGCLYSCRKTIHNDVSA